MHMSADTVIIKELLVYSVVRTSLNGDQFSYGRIDSKLAVKDPTIYLSYTVNQKPEAMFYRHDEMQ